LKKFVATLLAAQLALTAAQAQPQAQPQPQAPAAQTQPQAPVTALPTVENLKVLVLEGQRSTNNTTRHIGIQPVVEVRDENDRPVEGAKVVFRLPPSGPGGAFAGNSPTFSATTNAQGQAGASGFVPNSEQGRFDIHVTATYQNRTGEATISQNNSLNTLAMQTPPKPKTPIWRNKYLWIGAGAAVAVGVTLALTLGHSTSTKAVTITPGAVTINQ
jgi:hypothetical protein